MNPHDLPDQPLPDEMRSWLAALDPAERAELERTWALAGLAAEPDPAARRLDDAWSRLSGALEEEKSTLPTSRPRAADRAPRRHRSRRVPRWIGVPLTLAVLVVAVLLWRQQPIEIAAPLGARLTIELPDGSTIELSSGSTLTYRRGLRGEVRRVRLRGEVFFDVVESERPFVVETFNAAVTVLGTRFNVRAWPDDPAPETAVVLASGAVRLAAAGAPTQAVTLAPGQMSRVPTGADVPTPPEAVDLDTRLAWRRGGFASFDKPLGAVLADVERRFDIEVEVEPPSLAQVPISVYLPQAERAETVVADIAAYWGYQYRRTPTGYVLTDGEEDASQPPSE